MKNQQIQEQRIITMLFMSNSNQFKYQISIIFFSMMSIKIPPDTKYVKGNYSFLKSMQFDKIKDIVSDYFYEDHGSLRYMQVYTLSEAVKTVVKRMNLLKLLLNNQSKILYQDQLIKNKEYLHSQINQDIKKRQQQYEEIINKFDIKNRQNLETIENLEQIVRKLEADNHQKINQLKYYQDMIERLKQQLNEKIKEQEQQSLNDSNKIFMGEILQKAKDYQSYLYEVLQNITRKKIKDAKLLYRWDPHNKANFHLYIDGHPNILLVVLTKAQYYIAAFTEDPFIPNSSPSKQGCIFSLTNRQCFKNIKRPIIYDPYHIIFGNSQLRITMGKDEMFSNFGMPNTQYEGIGLSVSQLLGQDNHRNVQIQKYQILEILFQ